MPTLNSYGNMTLLEVGIREHYDDAEAVLGELQKMLELLQELPWFPTTHGLHNKQMQATRLGTGSFSKVNAPVPSISSNGTLIDEPVKLYEGDSEIDERLFAGGDAYQIRDSQDALNLEGAFQDWVSKLVYSAESTNEDSLEGFWARRATLAALNCRGCGGTGSDLSSIMLIEFGKRGLHMAYPKNVKSALVNEDRGRHSVPAPTGTGNYWAWIRHYEIWAAIVLRNERALQRICNIETAGSADLFDPSVFIAAKNQLPRMGQDAVAFANRTIKTQIEDNAYNKTNAAYRLVDIEKFGPVAHIAGVPVRMEESLLDTESAVA